MLNNIKKRSEGFTIIEVLIVLAIAGLILLIVFLAVPALQRNSRNTAIKNDVQNVLGGVGEFAAANSGAIPTSISGTGGTVTYTRAGGNDTTIRIQGSTTVATVTADTAPATGAINVRLQTKCSGTGITTIASTRSVAAFYVIETASGTVSQCVDS